MPLIPLHLIDLPIWVAILLLNGTFLLYLILRWRSDSLVTVDTFYVFKLLYLPMIFMIPFAYSALNIGATGDGYYQYIDFIPKAVGVVVAGVLATIMGMILGLSGNIKPMGLRWVQQSLTRFWLSSLGINLITITACGLVVLMLGLGFTPGAARVDAFERPSLRFVYNMYTIVVSFAILLVFAYAYIKKSKRYLFLGLCLFGLGFFSGTRATTVGLLISLIALYTITIRIKHVLPLLLSGVLVCVSLVYVLGFRDGVYDLSYVAKAPELLLFGNTFSDFRDFVWVMSGWDGNLLAGSTYISGFLSFIPSAFLPFRSETSWTYFSLVSSGLGGEAIAYQPGLRPIIFGETYFNFGLVGVLIGGMLLGFTLTQLGRIVGGVRGGDPQKRAALTLASIVYLDYGLLQLFNTSGFFTFYVIGGLLFLGFVLQSLKR